MSIENIVVVFLLLIVIFAILYQVHKHKFGTKDIASYRWFTNILR